MMNLKLFSKIKVLYLFLLITHLKCYLLYNNNPSLLLLMLLLFTSNYILEVFYLLPTVELN